MQQYRRGEQGNVVPPRAERFYKVDDDWYFLVRGGRTFGPFSCREEAVKAFENYLNPIQDFRGNVRPFGSQRARRWRNQHHSKF